ncbi:MAG TPA: hypothetical protein VG738_07650 [Chitinophagaceae bacterium]|nr:hypothetical protein [Chitinophagaceae bacterium]
MLAPEEKKFIEYWAVKREREKSLTRQIFFGLPFGLFLGICILVVFESGWYERATMVAYTQSSPYVLVAAIIIIAVFVGIFYKRYKWEMNEQRYRELLAKQKNDTLNATKTGI